ncbi:MAG: uracil-DNA glycosylase [Sphingomonas sp.]
MGANQITDWHDAVASAVAWWIDAGVDTIADETPRDWLAKAVAADRAPVPAGVVDEAPTAPPLPDTLEAFVEWRTGPDAPEALWPGPVVAAQGVAGAPLMIVIDLPEREDAESGVLMSGAAGRLFDRMLAAIGLDRSSAYLVALCTKRPVAGRIAPEIEERQAEILRHHVALAAPKRLLLLGNAPSRAITGADVAPARGSLHAVNLEGGTVERTNDDGSDRTRTLAVATFHPRLLLERPAMKAEAWKDLQMLIGGLQS